MKIDITPATKCFSKNGEQNGLCPIVLEEHLGVDRILEPVTMGIPFPFGMIMDVSELSLYDQRGERLLLQTEVLSKWIDGSVEWVLLDFTVTVGAHQKIEYRVECGDRASHNSATNTSMVKRKQEIFIVNTGKVCFKLNASRFEPFNQVEIAGVPILIPGKSVLLLMDDKGQTWEPQIKNMQVEAEGPIRVTLRAEGDIFLDSSTLVQFIARLNFYRESGVVAIAFTIRNPKAAYHQGGLWDLGDKGSIYFKDLSLVMKLQGNEGNNVAWKTSPLSGFCYSDGEKVELYQDSSGGENWQSSIHCNRYGQTMNTFSGYRVCVDGIKVAEGKRANPILRWENDDCFVAATVENFWQNFPKSIEVQKECIRVRLFPENYGDVFELQGGEQKTHTVYLKFSDRHQEQSEFDWIHSRLVPRSHPEWYAQSKAIGYLVPRTEDGNQEFCQLIDKAVIGEQSFFHRREVVDEYGWRHFGELHADHETVGQTEGESPRNSHYNNQYDIVNGTFIEFLRTGEEKWFSLMQDLARHVVDIDIYHTQEDRPSYNGGLFWHTDHYFDAGTGTHRTYSKVNKPLNADYGGGPSNEHNYTTGLLHYYYLTGDFLAREVVQGLADWVINMDKGKGGIVGWIDSRPSGLASSTVSRTYHGPGRGAGNSINALLDGFRVTLDRKYMDKAEELIRRCIHPQDRIEDLNLSDVEHRWSYTLFLQILGKYLDLKVVRQEFDGMYAYAKASLLHYAEWMVDHEVPYSHVLDRVERPTETWPAQDMRKSNVFKFAAKYADSPGREVFLHHSDLFFRASIKDLMSFDTCCLTRPLVLLLVNGYMHAYFQKYPHESAPPVSYDKDFGRPSSFTPQLNEIYRMKELGNVLFATLKSWGSR